MEYPLNWPVQKHMLDSWAGILFFNAWKSPICIYCFGYYLLFFNLPHQLIFSCKKSLLIRFKTKYIIKFKEQFRDTSILVESWHEKERVFDVLLSYLHSNSRSCFYRSRYSIKVGVLYIDINFCHHWLFGMVRKDRMKINRLSIRLKIFVEILLEN